MPDDNEAFEDYLRTFSGPEMPEGLARHAVAQARKRRAVRLWLGSGALVAAAAAVALVSTLRAPVDMNVPSTVTREPERIAAQPPSDTVDSRSLTLAYSTGGLDELEAQLDRASKRIATVTDAHTAGIPVLIWRL